MVMNPEHLEDWTERAEQAAIICAEPLRHVLEDLERRYEDRREELPGEEPRVSLRFVLNRLLTSLNEAADMEKYVSVQDAAELVGCSDETVYRRIRSGQLRHTKSEISGHYRIPVDELFDAMDARPDEGGAGPREVA